MSLSAERKAKSGPSCASPVEIPGDVRLHGFWLLRHAIGNAFFPSGNPFLSLMLSLMTFGAGFLMRPLGPSCSERTPITMAAAPASF